MSSGRSEIVSYEAVATLRPNIAVPRPDVARPSQQERCEIELLPIEALVIVVSKNDPRRGSPQRRGCDLEGCEV